MITSPRDIEPADLPGLFELNRREELALSAMTFADFQMAVGRAWSARCFPAAAGFLLAYDQSASLASPNFHWFHQRFDRFVYIDRVAVAEAARGQGLARAFYADLAGRSIAAGHRRLVAEVNLDPPNPASLAFHRQFGFAETGRARLPSGKTVIYLTRDLT